jgi:hypothetical protein
VTALHSFHLKRRRDHSGVALVLVLGFVVLLTIVVLVFLSREMNARQLSSGSLKQSSADQLAVSALDVVTGNLKSEIANPANSSATPYPSTASPVYTVYRPLGATNVPPIRFGNPAFTSPSPDPAPNLVRISSRSDASQNFPSSLASAVNSTTDASLNGRAVSLARWNSHYLLPLNNSATANTNSAPIASFNPPDWVLITDTGGPTVLTAPAANVIGRYAYAIYDEGGLLDVNVAGYPSKSTASQYGDKPALAYADLTQLGLSTTDVDNLVGWRNYASVQPTGTFGNFTIPAPQAQNFSNLITNNVTGFLQVNPVTWNVSGQNFTDQAFLSRQQLLKYQASAGSTTFTANVLQYLGTFSRDLNAPSWEPTFDATAEGGNIGSGSTPPFAYKTNAETPTISNPLATGLTESNPNLDVLAARVTSAFPNPRADGTYPQIGEPLVKYRFPLNRLAGITYQGIDITDKTTLVNGVLSPATVATIQRDFGLVWVPGDGNGNPTSIEPTDLQSAPHWNYCGPTGTTLQSSIATLGSIGNREPNFFELLKAAILSGSLGRDAGPNGVFNVNDDRGPASGNQPNDMNIDLQVIQLGANIIDQSDTDSYPTEIHFSAFVPSITGGSTGETTVYGIENLPYMQRVFAKTINNYTDNSTNPPGTGAAGWYMAELWNPHQNFGYTSTTAIPTNFRFCGEGFSAVYSNQGSPPPNSSALDLSQQGYIQFSVPWNSNFCRDPTLLSTDSGNPPSFASPNPNPTVVNGAKGVNSYYSNAIEGIYTGFIPITPGQSAGVQPTPGTCDLMLEYQAPDSTWRIYNKMRNLTAEHDWDPGLLGFYYQHVDPRTDRFGTSLGMWVYWEQINGVWTNVNLHRPGGSIRVDNGAGWWSYDFFPVPYTELTPAQNTGFNFTQGNSDSQIFSFYNNPGNVNPSTFFMGTLSDNVATLGTSYPGQNVVNYTDQDGVLRPAEGCYATGDGNYDGRPLVPGNPNSRPIILNRPFRNVGELGYAFRDLPWKNIDFFTPNTGDAGLLDFFCINESTTTTPMVAGIVNLNTRQAPVLQAIIAGAIKDETDNAQPTDPPIPSTEAASIASAIVGWTQSSSSGQGPFQYRGDLLTKASSMTPFYAASTLVASGAAASDQQIKIRREAALRALSDVGTTRTWTLMVDLVAQVGHYPPNATTLKQFVVDGEKRYWLHIAIDRYTGQVIDRVLEPVYE